MHLVYWEPNTMLLFDKSLILTFFRGVDIDITERKQDTGDESATHVSKSWILPYQVGWDHRDKGYEIQLGRGKWEKVGGSAQSIKLKAVL